MITITRWTAATLTAILGALNLGTFTDESAGAKLTTLGLILGAVGVLAAYGLLTATWWGRNAVIGIGIVNVVVGVVALASDIQTAWLGLLLAVLAVVLALGISSSASSSS